MFNIGDKVRFINEELHEEEPRFFPAVGTVGKVLYYDYGFPVVEFPDGTVEENSMGFSKYVPEDSIELVKE